MEKKLIFVCLNVDCRVRQAAEVMEKLKQEIGPDESMEVRSYMCFGACHEGPNVVVYPDKVWYAGVKPEDVAEIIASLRGDQPPGHPGTPGHQDKLERLDTIDPSLKAMIFQLLDVGLY